MAKYLAITGGVGGAKLALGLTHKLAPHELAFIANTGDDFEHLGLHVSPDLDTLMYTLSGLSNGETGWGRVNESWHCLDTLASLGGESWFRLGDRDLAVHLQRTQLLTNGSTLSEVTATLFSSLGVDYAVWPMSDQAVATRVMTAQGELAFQHYFVRERCEPHVTAIRFDGAEQALAVPAALNYLRDPDLAGVIICPSNPFLSVDPIFAINELRAALEACAAPVVAVSPLVEGTAIKGPTAKIMNELGMTGNATAVAQHYGALIDGFILDQRDAALTVEIATSNLAVITAQTIMNTLDDRIDLAHTAIQFLHKLS